MCVVWCVCCILTPHVLIASLILKDAPQDIVWYLNSFSCVSRLTAPYSRSNIISITPLWIPFISNEPVHFWHISTNWIDVYDVYVHQDALTRDLQYPNNELMSRFSWDYYFGSSDAFKYHSTWTWCGQRKMFESSYRLNLESQTEIDSVGFNPTNNFQIDENENAARKLSINIQNLHGTRTSHPNHINIRKISIKIQLNSVSRNWVVCCFFSIFCVYTR